MTSVVLAKELIKAKERKKFHLIKSFVKGKEQGLRENRNNYQNFIKYSETGKREHSAAFGKRNIAQKQHST